MKVLFVGNSITRHLPKPDIGWSGCWGMAASREANDYVHLIMAKLRERAPEANFEIAQLAQWERSYPEGAAQIELPKEAADVIVVRIGENVPSELLAQTPLAPALVEMMRRVDVSGRARFLVTGLFWRDEAKERALREAARAVNAPFVPLDDLGARPEMRADGLFAHAGVAAHPGDAGMRAIAERIFAALAEMTNDGAALDDDALSGAVGGIHPKLIGKFEPLKNVEYAQPNFIYILPEDASNVE